MPLRSMMPYWAYDRAKFLPQRVAMMQNYANYLDEVYIEELTKDIAA